MLVVDTVLFVRMKRLAEVGALWKCEEPVFEISRGGDLDL